MIKLSFDSISELVEHVSNLPSSSPCNKYQSQEFSKTDSFEQTLKLAKEGYQSERPTIEAMITMVKSQVSETIELGFTDMFDVSGSFVDMGRFVSGEPECMVTSVLEPTTKHGKVARILVDCCYNASVQADQVLARGACLMVLIELLRLMGQNVELYAEMSTKSSNDNATTVVCIKSAEDSIDIDSIAYAIAHPSFLRGLYFGVIDRYEAEHGKTKGLGAPGYGVANGLTMSQELEADLSLKAPNNVEKYNADWVIAQLRTLGLIE